MESLSVRVKKDEFVNIFYPTIFLIVPFPAIITCAAAMYLLERRIRASCRWAIISRNGVPHFAYYTVCCLNDEWISISCKGTKRIKERSSQPKSTRRH